MDISSDPFVVEYFEWLLKKVHADSDGEYCNYRNLIYRLWQTNYHPSNPQDDHRRGDGLQLRYAFAYENQYSYTSIEESTLNPNGYYECRVLEMMIALARRMENTLLSNWREDRTYVWFWRMISALGFESLDDFSWDPNEEINPVDRTLERMMDGSFSPNGEGSLFVIYDPYYDCREHQIWDVMQKWVTENSPVYLPD